MTNQQFVHNCIRRLARRGAWPAAALSALFILLGLGVSPAAAAVTPTGPTEVISAGFLHSCALTVAGAAECWGSNDDNEAGSHTGPYTQITTSLNHTCALTPAGAVECWGNNTYGQLDAPAGTYVQVSAGYFFTCALTSTGDAECWGFNNFGQATNQTGPFTQVSTGNGHACALTAAGDIECWGLNGSGQADNHTGPYAQVNAGEFITCALTPTGDVECWGYNDEGAAGNHTGPYTEVSAGGHHSCALTATGAAECWGSNVQDQAGDHTGPYTQITTGAFHTCALTPAGAAECWGYNTSGQAENQAGPFADPTPPSVMGTIEVVKQAGDVGEQFEFDPSWSDDNFLLYSGGSQTSDPLPAGSYSVAEVNLPPGWSLDNASCVNEDGPLTPVQPVDPSNIPVEDGDEWVCTFTNVYTPPSNNICPVEEASNLYTDILGTGMGSTKKHKTQVKLNVPNWMNVDTLYGQLVGKDSGKANYVRFILPGKNNFVQVDGVTSAIDHAGGNFWYGDYIDPAKYVKGRWFLQKSGAKGHLPRAFVLYPTYEDANKTYVNVWDTYDAAEGEVYWDTANGWTPIREIVVPIAPPNGPTTFHVELAVVDNDKDNRQVWVTVTAGGVTQTVSPNNPDHGDQLNLLTFDLANVPAGTDEIVIEIASYEGDGAYGDSATLVGMAANYMCAPLNN